MKIEHTLKRFKTKETEVDGSFIKVGGVNYHFAPVTPGDQSSPQVANVEVEDHQTIFLNQRPTVFLPYAGKEAVEAPVPPAPLPHQLGKVVTDDVGPDGSGHPDEVEVRVGDPKVKLAAVISRAIQEMAISVKEWNGMAETARFQAVEDVISGERMVAEQEKNALERLENPVGDDGKPLGERKLEGAPEDTVTPTRPLAELHLNKLRSLGKQYGISDADNLRKDELVSALAPFVAR